MFKRLIKKLIKKVLPERIFRVLKIMTTVEATLRHQEDEIDRLRGDVNRLLSLVRLNQFNNLGK